MRDFEDKIDVKRANIYVHKELDAPSIVLMAEILLPKLT